MCKITLETNQMKAATSIEPQADFMGCLLPALLQALPIFIQAFVECLGSGGTTTGYNPGGPKRC